MLIVPTVPAEARPLLDHIRTQREHSTMFVLARGEDGSRLASKADVRAENHPFRKVVWVMEPSVLSEIVEYSEVAASADAGAIVCTLTFNFQLSSTLKSSDVIDFVAIEEAFISAGGGR